MDTTNTEQETSVYLDIWENYQLLGNGAKADIKRVAKPNDLLSIGALFRLCKQRDNLQRYARVVYILPWLGHKKGETLGALFGSDPKHRVSEARLFQMLRAEYPNDIIALRRIIWQAAGRHAEKSVDWNELGKQLFYWGDFNKQRILQDYYISEIATTKHEEE